MSKIKAELTFNIDCILTIKDTSGFKSATNPDGFLPQNQVAATGQDFHITDGYFINILLYHKYLGEPLVLNPVEDFKKILSVNINYDDNFIPKSYSLTKDGVYSLKRIFVISKDYYTTYKDIPNWFGNKEIIYYDNDTNYFYRIVNGVPAQIDFIDLALNFNEFNFGCVSTYKFVSTCNLNKCQYLLQKQYVESIGECDRTKNLSRERDLIFMTINVIKYLRDGGQLLEVQKIIESIDTCGLACSKISGVSYNDCGCG